MGGKSLSARWLSISILVSLAALPAPPAHAAQAPSPQIEKEYNKLLAFADLKAKPEQHRQIAAWCRSHRWPEQAEVHDRAYNLITFQKELERLKPDAAAADIKRLEDLATRLKLADEAKAMKDRRLGLELKDRGAALKTDDAAGHKALLQWAVEQGAGGGEELDALAKKVVALDPKDATANGMLGRVQDGEAWIDPWELLVKRGGLKDVKVRYEIHKKLEELCKEKPRAYAKDPLANVKKTSLPNWPPNILWEDGIRGLGDGKSAVFLWLPKDYDPSKSWPLMVALHGGGDGDVPASLENARQMLVMYPTRFPKTPYIVIAPTLCVHPINAWNVKENMLNVVDAIIDACSRFNIDRKRIFLMGSSMGGQGTSRFSWVVPECFAAFSPWCGAYWNNYPVPDLTGKPFLVIHGAKDAAFRNKTLEEFLGKIKLANADVTYSNYPDAGHNLPDEKCIPEMLEFFAKRTNDFAPDLRLVRKVIEETVKERPHGEKK